MLFVRTRNVQVGLMACKLYVAFCCYGEALFIIIYYISQCAYADVVRMCGHKFVHTHVRHVRSFHFSLLPSLSLSLSRFRLLDALARLCSWAFKCDRRRVCSFSGGWIDSSFAYMFCVKWKTVPFERSQQPNQPRNRKVYFFFVTLTHIEKLENKYIKVYSWFESLLFWVCVLRR